MDIQETAKSLLEAEETAKSAATKPKFTHSVKGGKHKDSEGLEGSTQGMPPEGSEEDTFKANVASKESERPTDEKMPGKKAGKLRKKDSMTDPESEVETEIDYLADNPGKKAAEKGKDVLDSGKEIGAEIIEGVKGILKPKKKEQ